MINTHHVPRDLIRALPVVALLFGLSCRGTESGRAVLSVGSPLHLEDHLGAARVVESNARLDVPDPIEWRFDEPQTAWKALAHVMPDLPPPQVEQLKDALRVSLSADHRDERRGRLHGDFCTPIPELNRADWSHVLVRARASKEIRSLQLGFNLRGPGEPSDGAWLSDGIFLLWGDDAHVVNDGTVQTYRLRADWSSTRRQSGWTDPWRELCLSINAGQPSSIDILSVILVSKAAAYAGEPAAVRFETRSQRHRRTLYMRVPGRIEYRVHVPEAARLDVGLGVLRDDVPVEFRVTATPEGGEPQTLLEETYADRGLWAQRSVDLSAAAGRTVSLALEADAEGEGNVAFWAAPTVSVGKQAEKPNIIFYVIDGGGADYMSLYGYHRRTTPNLERLAAEGAVFERAYSNSTWSKPSTTSFMTSLHNSVLGNTRSRFDPLPEQAVTMAQHFHRARYQTAVFTSNPWAASMSSLDRGIDVMRDAGVEKDSSSSVELHRDFWSWRSEYPGTPYWVHFQTTDVHDESGDTDPPFGGLFLSPDQEKVWRAWDERLEKEGAHGPFSEAYEKTGLSRADFFAFHQRMYDQNLAHQDYQIDRFVERLKASGEWENTLLIIGADHSTEAAADDMGVAILETLPPQWVYAMLRPSVSRVPLIFFWPGHIEGGQRFRDAVSMIDVLPTLLDLVDLPEPDVMQGQSLAPLLLGRSGWEPRPVILDEFELDSATGRLHGMIEVVDGRWGASLWVGPEPVNEKMSRPMPLLLFDLWDDPWCLSPVNEEWPEKVEEYTGFLEAQWEAHQTLARRFTAGAGVALTPEQLEALRSLGYIQ